MTTATEATWEVVRDSVLDDDGRGYPNKVTFVPMDIDDWQEIAWDSICTYGPTVIVDEHAAEIMFVPRQRRGPMGWLNRLRGRIPVEMTWRSRGAENGYRVPTTMSRKRLGEFNGKGATAAA